MGQVHLSIYGLGQDGSMILIYRMGWVGLGPVVKFSQKNVHNITFTDITSRQSVKWKDARWDEDPCTGD